MKRVKQIYRVTTWPQFFVNVALRREKFSDLLKETVIENKGCYYGPAPPEKIYN